MTTTKNYGESVDALKSLKSGSDRWRLADSLLKEVGPGESRSRFQAMRREAEEDGIENPLSVSALRQYRDVAAHWPPDTRIDGVSFSAHRAAKDGSDDPQGLLRDLVATHGKSVTVATVKDAAAVLKGSTPTASQSGSSGASLSEASPTALLGHLISRYQSESESVLSVVDKTALKYLSEIVKETERRYAIAGKKAKAWSGKSAKSESAKSEEETERERKRAAGDLRGL